MKRILLIIIAALFLPLILPAQTSDEQVDSLVSLLSAKSMQLIQKDSTSYRKVTGPARFLHNNTYLICDTALWNVNTEIIDCIGNVQILQGETVLTGDSLKYLSRLSLAQFRGHLVQLEDKDHNILRTRTLDYNTRDSIAVFQNGGAMKDKDGQIIESINGTYDSKAKTFLFTDNVNMFTDSIFVKTTRLEYLSDQSLAIFGHSTDAWKEDYMLSANAGWYNNDSELFFFNRNVHSLSVDKEAWSDSLYYYRKTSDIDLYGNVQLVDSVRQVTALAGSIEYVDSLSRITMTKSPSIIGVSDTTGTRRDSVWFAADLLVYETIQKHAVDSLEADAAAKRLENQAQDAVMAYRLRAAEEARAAAQKAQAEKEEAEGRNIRNNRNSFQTGISQIVPAADSSTAETPLIDSLSAAPVVIDTTEIGFITAVKNVRLYREDMQMVCDSLRYSDLDSLVRLYRDPIVWNEGNRQYSSDSLFLVIKDKKMQKANLLDNAFVIIKEDTLCFDQVRASEMIAYFDENNSLKRFDALGDANALFYIEEDSTLATVNTSQSKMMHAVFKDGEIDEIYYFQGAQSDASPVAQLTTEDRTLKGFTWQPELCPKGPEDITSYKLRKSQRQEYESRPRAKYEQTGIYFPDYMDGVYKQIEENRLARAERRRREAVLRDSLDRAAKDSLLRAAADSLKLADSLKVKDLTPAADSISVKQDSVSVSDSLAVPDKVLSEKELKAKAREEARKAKTAAKESRWAELDAKDKKKQEAKAEKKAEKLRRRKKAALEKQKKQDKKDSEYLEHFVRQYEKKKATLDKKAALKKSKKAEKSSVEEQASEQPKIKLKSLNKTKEQISSSEQQSYPES